MKEKEEGGRGIPISLSRAFLKGRKGDLGRKASEETVMRR